MFGLGSLEGVLVLSVLIVGILPIVITLWALIDVLRNEFTGSNKIIWALVIICLPPFGAIFYYFIGTKQKTSNLILS
jgi:hypothetical protein